MRKDAKRLFERHKNEYLEAIHSAVCDVCIDRSADGKCRTKDPKGCAVIRYLPQLVAIALELHEAKLEPYVEAVREHLCLHCGNSPDHITCTVRDNADCGLNRYLPLVLEAVESVNRKFSPGA